MKAVFAHDHRFIAAQGETWSESQFSAQLWTRYLQYFEHITVAGRTGQLPAGKSVAQLERSSHPLVSFALFPNLSNFRGLTLGRAIVSQRMSDLVAQHDAVIARLPSEIGLLAIEAARRHSKPCVIEVVGCAWDSLRHHGSLAGQLYAPLAWWRMRTEIAKAQHVTYVTGHFLQTRYPTHALNTAWASDVELPQSSEDVLAKRLYRIGAIKPITPLNLGLIGTLRSRYKGIQVLFRALARVKDQLPPLKVRILGGGSTTPWVREARLLGIDDLVEFDGTLASGIPVLNWLDDIDVYVQPSLQEGLPRAVIEAMSRGCPAIASAVAGIPELLPAEDLTQPGDDRGLAQLLLKYLNDTSWMAERASRNWTLARTFQADTLEARRATFWRRFFDSAENVGSRHVP
jgi:glycosyltransferase involved in cell wall biosynthesis